MLTDINLSVLQDKTVHKIQDFSDIINWFIREEMEGRK